MTLIDKDPLVFYKNYDLYDTEGAAGKAKQGPGTGLYGPEMDKYKSVQEFREKNKKRKKRIKKRQAQIIQMFLALAEDDKNNLTDPYESQGITPMPYAPAEPAPIGILDGIYPHEDMEGYPTGSPYYGTLETHQSDDGNFSNNKESEMAYLLGQQLGKEDKDILIPGTNMSQTSDILAGILSLKTKLPFSDYLAYCSGYIDGSEMPKIQAETEIKRVLRYLEQQSKTKDATI